MYIYTIRAIWYNPMSQRRGSKDIDVLADNRDEALFRAGNVLGIDDPYHDTNGDRIWVEVLHRGLYTKY